MFSFATVFVAAAVAAGVLASPAGTPAALAKRNSSNSSGMNNGFHYQFWDDGFTTTYTNGAAGLYSVTWSNCSDGKSHGTLYSDGSDYQVCLVDRGNNYLQNWSVCKNKRTSGTVTMANYYNYYQSQGMTDNPLSAAAYQIVSMEYCGSSGSVSITVSSDAPVGSSNSSTPSMPSTSASSIPSSIPISGNCAQLYGQWGGIG
ncbi:hypothetical protein ACMFMF_007990 [Clarireedia jacksonii]